MFSWGILSFHSNIHHIFNSEESAFFAIPAITLVTNCWLVKQRIVNQNGWIIHFLQTHFAVWLKVHVTAGFFSQLSTHSDNHGNLGFALAFVLWSFWRMAWAKCVLSVHFHNRSAGEIINCCKSWENMYFGIDRVSDVADVFPES